MTKFWIGALCITVVTAILFIGGFILVEKHFQIYAAPENTILIFIGILATFIVVSNYAQVADVKKELQKKILEVEQRMNSITDAMSSVTDRVIDTDINTQDKH
jgi:flagellar motor component MotA